MSNSKEDNSKRLALVINIHGTNDAGRGTPNDAKWWETSSAFTTKLKSMLGQEGMLVDIDEHVWGGANSAFARHKGSSVLIRKLRKYSKAYDEIHLIGHSHGGNVAVDAAKRASWGSARAGRFFARKPINITSLTTVGTPFLRSQARGADYLYALAFVVLMFVAVLAFSIGPAITLTNVFKTIMLSQPIEDTLSSEQLIYSSVSGVLCFVSLWMFRHRWGRFRWIARLLRQHTVRANLLSIWHANDEAIGGLKRAELFSPELVPRGALWSGAHRIGMKIGSLAFVLSGLLVLSIVGLIAVATLLPDLSLSAGIQVLLINLHLGGVEKTVLMPVLSIMGLLAGAVMAVGLYAGVRLMFGALPELALRGFLNSRGSGVLRAFAFGSDTGQPLGEVSERPHFYDGKVWVIPPPLAEKMETDTLQTLSRFLARHRTSLFGVGMTADWMDGIGSDPETWDSLIHTTYFDHDEVIQRISEHIAGAAVSESEGGCREATKTLTAMLERERAEDAFAV